MSYNINPYLIDPQAQQELRELMARLDRKISTVWSGQIDMNDVVVDADPVPEILVWTCDHDDKLDRLVVAVWEWDEAIRLARGLAVIAGIMTAVTPLDQE